MGIQYLSSVVALIPLVLPTSSKAGDLARGKAVYAQNCVVCHGLHGKGNGPTGKTLSPKPTDFTTAEPNDAEWFKATKLGTKAVGKSDKMEGYSGKLTDDDIRAVLAYAKSFKGK